jgi:p-cumate 2,3-dioxygenase beta subunit
MNAAAWTRAQVEDFLYHEADLLDRWELMAWVGLFTADGQYLVPSTDAPAGDPSTTLSLIYDDRHRLEERAKRLMSKAAHAEFPHSQTRHLVSNVRIVQADPDGSLHVACNFVVYRSKGETNDVYPGHSTYELVTIEGALRIRVKRAVIDVQSLRPQGKVSIIL